jgi:hypothetical protein
MIDKYVTDIIISSKLFELGVKQNSQCYWYKNDFNTFIDSEDVINQDIHRNHADPQKVFSCFNASELLELLPYSVTTNEKEPFNTYRLQVWGSCIVKNPELIEPIRTHVVNYKCESIDLSNRETILAAALGKYLTQNIWDENPANALAKMLIYLYENGLIKNE